MANSLIHWAAKNAVFPASAPAGVKFRAGTNHPSMTLAFAGNAGSADEYAYFLGVVPQVYDGGNLQVVIYWEADTGSPASENCSWDVGVLGRTDDEAFDAAASDTGTINDVVTAAGDVQIATLTLTTPSLVAGDLIVLTLSRDYDEADGGTALDEDALLHAIELREA